MLDVGNLIDRRPPQLTHALGDTVHTVDVGLTELTAVGIEGQSAADLYGPSAMNPCLTRPQNTNSSN